jgi:hypothetical protein
VTATKALGIDKERDGKTGEEWKPEKSGERETKQNKGKDQRILAYRARKQFMPNLRKSVRHRNA